jgi:hypothetical protein
MAAKTDFRIWFYGRSGLVKIERSASSEAEAVKQAQEEFMWRFGFYPGDPHQVDRTSF